MRAVYGLNMTTMEHHLICDGIGAKFSIQGKYLGSNAVAHRSSLPADVASILQQGSLCELAVLSGDRFLKKQMPITQAQAFISSVQTPCKASFQIKRKVGEALCVQYLYIYPIDKLNSLLPSVF